MMIRKMNLLNSFKDQEVLNAFKLALINTDQGENITSEDEFYNEVGRNFVKLIRKKNETMSDELEDKLNELNIHSDSQPESSIISDFGDIIPVNLYTEDSATKKSHKWTIGEQKKLASLINNRQIHEVDDSEWEQIAIKLDRSKASVTNKAQELIMKKPNINKKRKVQEATGIVHETKSNFSKADREMTNSIYHSEYDALTEEQGKSVKSDCLVVSRKKALEKVLNSLPERRGTKNQIFDELSRFYNLPMHDSSSAHYKGFQQCLSKYFRHTKGFYALKTDTAEYVILDDKLKTTSKFFSCLTIS